MTRNFGRIAGVATALGAVAALALAVMSPASAATTVRTIYSPHGASAQGPSTATPAAFTADEAGDAVVLAPQREVSEDDFQFVSFGLPWDHAGISAVRVCYKVNAAGTGGTYISQTRMTEMTVPPTGTVRLDNGTDRTSTKGECYTVRGSFTPKGTVTLSLKVVFGNTNDSILIGALQLSGNG
jgi:hypothetical protein